MVTRQSAAALLAFILALQISCGGPTRDINAFALPGGFVFVNAGAIAAAKNEGELAGVMAHEISHVALRHPTNQASKAYIAQKGIGAVSEIFGGRDSDLG